MGRTNKPSMCACPNTDEPVFQDWSQLYICTSRGGRSTTAHCPEDTFNNRSTREKASTISRLQREIRCQAAWLLPHLRSVDPDPGSAPNVSSGRAPESRNELEWASAGGEKKDAEIQEPWVRPDLCCGVQSVKLLLSRVQRYCRGQLPPTRQVSTSLFPSNATCCRVPLPRRKGATSDTKTEY